MPPHFGQPTHGVPREERMAQVLRLLGDRELMVRELAALAPRRVEHWTHPVSGDTQTFTHPEREATYQALEYLRLQGRVDRRRHRRPSGSTTPYVYFRVPGPPSGEIVDLEAALHADQAGAK